MVLPIQVALRTVFIGRKTIEQCPHDLGIYRRYRDDTTDIVKTTIKEEYELVTEWLNQFKMESEQDEINNHVRFEILNLNMRRNQKVVFNI